MNVLEAWMVCGSGEDFETPRVDGIQEYWICFVDLVLWTCRSAGKDIDNLAHNFHDDTNHCIHYEGYAWFEWKA